jgi:hypothetical protein
VNGDPVGERDPIEAGKRRTEEVQIAQLKADIDQYAATANALASKISVGYEMTDVKCQIQDDLATLVRAVIRLDTGEIIDVATVPENERQTEFMDDPVGSAAAAPSGGPAPAGEIKELQAPQLQIEHKPDDGAPAGDQPAGPQE